VVHGRAGAFVLGIEDAVLVVITVNSCGGGAGDIVEDVLDELLQGGIIAQLGGVAFCARGSLDSVKNIRQAKKYMRQAFEAQTKGLGFGFVELLSGCPTNWRMTPLAANKRITEEMIPYFPLGVYKELEGDGTCGSLVGGK